MNECERLINNYFNKNPGIKNRGFHAISKEEMIFIFENVNAFERPDMYVVLDDKIILIEHFAFDASKRTRKGMQGQKEEALLKQRISNAPIDNEFHIDKGNYEISLKNWQSNFEQIFDSHYKKIPEYKKSIGAHLKMEEHKEILVGFFIENQYSPTVYDGKKNSELYYFDTIQFSEKIIDSKELDFVLFGSHHKGYPQLFYFDKNSFDEFRPQIDLTNTTLKISPVCKNECTMYGKFSE